MNAQAPQVEAFFRLMSANGVSQVYRTAWDVGLMQQLTSTSATAEELASRCDLRSEPVALVLGILQTMELVEQQDGRYALTPFARFLFGSDYRRLGDSYWDHLESYLRSAEPLMRMDDADQSEQMYRAQAMSLAWMLGPSAEAAASILVAGMERGSMAVLDIGAGAAIWSLAFARRNPDAHVTALDRPAVLEVAAGLAQQWNLQDRFHSMPGDFRHVELPRQHFDIAILGNITHLLPVEGCLALIKRACGTLKPGGRVAIFDVLPGHAEGDINRCLYGLGLALRTGQGRVKSREELEHMLIQAGCEDCQSHALDAPPHTMGLILGMVPDTRRSL